MSDKPKGLIGLNQACAELVSVNWTKVKTDVKRLQGRIAKAVREGKSNKVNCLQWILSYSYCAKLLAVSLWRWIKRRHPQKSCGRIIKHYFNNLKRKWVFSCWIKDRSDKKRPLENRRGIEHCLFLHEIWITQKGNIMKNKNKSIKNIDPLPDTFVSEEEAGEFWDSHSTSDYEEYLEPVDMTIDIKRRHFEIEIDRESFLALNAYAKKVNKPVKNLASSILKEKLVSEKIGKK